MTAATPGRAEYETWRAAVPDVVCNVPAGPWDELSPGIQAGFAAVAAQAARPAPAHGKRDPLACPCCVFGDDDCWCRADCGAGRCQARDVDTQSAPGLAAAMRETASRELAAAMAESRRYLGALQVARSFLLDPGPSGRRHAIAAISKALEGK